MQLRTIAIAIAVLIPLLGVAGAIDSDEIIVPSLTVRGSAILEKPADQLRIRISVVTEDDEATTAFRENSQQMRDVIKALKKEGLTEDEYQTSQIRIQPQYSRRPRQAGVEWKPVIVGYQVSSSINVKTKQLKLAGELIQAANEAGANSIDSISFGLADHRKHRAEAIKAATANALADAKTLADAANLKLVRVITINLDQAASPRPMPMSMNRSMEMAMASSVAPPPVNPGDVNVQASVTVVYEIAEKN
ncbi:MAG: SIMPL domain-containing protein [Planctomycetes bacterium]|nr:SIMPL domain-containing protein [Planctomycetota bacterium]